MTLHCIAGIAFRPCQVAFSAVETGINLAMDRVGGVLGLVFMVAGALVVAGAVHVFRSERFEPLVRPAIPTGLIGYLLAVGALLVDLGGPYNVWRPMINWQHHSVLWEVGVCVTLYTAVLIIEFLPIALERVNKIARVTNRLPTVTLYQMLS